MPRKKRTNKDPSRASALHTCPMLVAWLRTVPAVDHLGYSERAEALLSKCDNALGVGAVLRIMMTERRLAHWGISAERTASFSRKQHREALREMRSAEKDLVRAWAAYHAAREPEHVRAVGAPSTRDLIG